MASMYGKADACTAVQVSDTTKAEQHYHCWFHKKERLETKFLR
jgi:hypothetical protein